MNINLKFLLLGTSLSLIPQYAAAQCAETDCLKLGYTTLEKCDNGLKCPFGEYWACPKITKAELGRCNGYAKNCSVGQILNSDGTCTTDKISSKTPLGVIIAIEDNCGYAMTVKPIEKGIMWSKVNVNVGTLQADSWDEAIKDFDVQGNMKKIQQTTIDNHGDAAAFYYPAVYAALDYTPDNAPETKGKWCLPTAGLLNSLYINISVIDNTILKLGGEVLAYDTENTWSSSVHDNQNVWGLSTGLGSTQGGIAYMHKSNDSNNYTVRPVLPF